MADVSTKQNFSATLAAKLNLKYTGAKPSTMRLKWSMDVKEASINTQSVKLKMEFNDEAIEKHGIICIDIENSANRLPKDILDFEGDNEPVVEQNIHITMGKVSKDDRDKGELTCLTNHADIKIVGTARRSVDQQIEAGSQISPYQECRAQKTSASYPGPFVPPSPQCFTAAAEQTNLRAGNVSITYKVNRHIALDSSLKIDVI